MLTLSSCAFVAWRSMRNARVSFAALPIGAGSSTLTPASDACKRGCIEGRPHQSNVGRAAGVDAHVSVFGGQGERQRAAEYLRADAAGAHTVFGKGELTRRIGKLQRR